jgi:hypothetical protein
VVNPTPLLLAAMYRPFGEPAPKHCNEMISEKEKQRKKYKRESRRRFESRNRIITGRQAAEDRGWGGRDN